MRLIFLFFQFICLGHFFAQSYFLKYSFEDNWFEKKKPDSIFKNKDLANKYLLSLQNQYIENGFLLFSLTSSFENNVEKKVSIFLGPKFKSARITIDSSELKFLKRHDFNNSEVTLSSNALKNYLSKIINVYLNNGYPFVKVSFKDCSFPSENRLSGKLIIAKGNKYQWGNIIIKGDSSLSNIMLQTISGIRPGKTYNESILKELEKQLQLIPFLDQFKKPELLFTDKTVDVYVYLKAKPVSSVNGAIGLQPNPATQRMALTGQLQLKLQNTLKKAELIELNWRSIQPGTQNLFLNGNLPYLFKSKFGLDGKFNLYKRDSTFLELKSNIALTYQLKNNFVIKGFYSFWSNSILNTNEINTFSSTNNNSYGISIIRKNLDYIPNPRKGFSLITEMSAGNRKVGSESEVKFSAKGFLALESYIPLAKRHVLKLSGTSDWIFNEQTFLNERIRFGGLNSLRGFNEEELYATFYAMGQIEYRFLLDRNSNLFAFYNQAWYEDNSIAQYSNDAPLGFGAGLSFGTKLGIFSITYALGKQLTNSIQFNQGKIHIGYISFF